MLERISKNEKQRKKARRKTVITGSQSDGYQDAVVERAQCREGGRHRQPQTGQVHAISDSDQMRQRMHPMFWSVLGRPCSTLHKTRDKCVRRAYGVGFQV